MVPAEVHRPAAEGEAAQVAKTPVGHLPEGSVLT